jgi:hypothetical protein
LARSVPIAKSRTEFAYHDPLVEGEGVTVLVMPSRENFLVVFKVEIGHFPDAGFGE